MRLFDMHCDTLYRAYTENSGLSDDSFHISFNKTKGIAPYIQCLAVWIPDEYRGEDAWELFCGCAEKLSAELKDKAVTWCRSADDIRRVTEEKGKGIILTVEGGAVLGGRAERIPVLYDMGVRMMTLTWNDRNELGDGIGEAEDRGLTPFGKECVRIMEDCGIIIDLSHAGEKLFYDVAGIARKPFVTSHSNIRTITPQRRNLTEDEFRCLMRMGGITGLNFCAEFLNNNKTNAKMYDIIKHAQTFIELGGKSFIAMGADFDGADIPADMKGVETMPELYDMFVSELGAETTDAVFFGNAYRFFTENLR